MSAPEPDRPARAPVLRIRDVPAGTGLAWIRRGIRLFVRRPGAFLGLFGVVLLTLLAMLVLPAVLRLLALALTPLMSLGFMIATEAVVLDGPVHPGQFVQPLAASSAERRALLQLGLCYVLAAAAVFLLSDRIDGGEATRWMLAMSTPQPDGTPPEPPSLSALGALALSLQVGWFALVSVPLWYAPALVHWGHQGAAHAMFSSIVALWRTRGAFVMYQLGWAVIASAFGLVAALVADAVGDPRAGVLLLTPAMGVLTVMFYVSLWPGFVDTFEIRPAADPP